MASPIIPGTINDRTGSAGIQRRAVAEIRRRYAKLQAEVLAIFDRIPVYQLNAEFGQVAYGMTAEQMQLLNDELADAFERWIVSGKEAAHVFWYSTYDSEASQLGAAQSNANLANLSEAYAATRPIQSIIYSTPYKNRLAMAQIKSMDHWTGLAATQKSELTQIIGRAVVDGKNPKAVRTEIMERLDVSRSKAASYAQSDVTDTLRQARWAETDEASESLNLKIGLLWTSALLPTTRPNHASRNGKVYTTEEVRLFYSSNGERYNCHCGQTQALLDANGNPILTDKLKASMLAEKQAWEKSQEKESTS